MGGGRRIIQASPYPNFAGPANIDNKFRHVHRLYIANDGNFHQQSKSKNGDPTDVSLVKGRGTFPVEQSYKYYLSKVGDSAEVCTFSLR